MSAPFVLGLRILLALSLYTFLGWTLFTLWHELHTQGTLLAARKVPSITLKIQTDKNAPSLRHFTQAEILIGRDLHCDIPLIDDTVSVRHARLSYHHAQWWLEDLGSTNGTQLNQEKISMPTVVINGDQVACGKAILAIKLGMDPGESSTQRIPPIGDTK